MNYTEKFTLSIQEAIAQVNNLIKLTSKYYSLTYKQKNNCYTLHDDSKLKKFIALQEKKCSKKECKVCPHSLFWSMYEIQYTKTGEEIKKYKKHYEIGKIPYQIKRQLSNPSKEKLKKTEEEIKKVDKIRKQLVALQRKLNILLMQIPDETQIKQLIVNKINLNE